MEENSAKTSTSQPRTRWQWLLVLTLVLLALLAVLIPAWFIQPFRPQNARQVALAYALKSWSPFITTCATVLAAWLMFRLWRVRAGFLRRSALLLLSVPLLAATWFARQNHFEWMFAPLSAVAYANANAANFVDEKDMVMAIEVNGEAVAYPIRQMAYHHVVNDVVGGRPITATY